MPYLKKRGKFPFRRRHGFKRKQAHFKHASYTAIVSRALGTKMTLTPVTSAHDLYFRRVRPQPNQDPQFLQGASQYFEVAVSVMFNAASSDIFLFSASTTGSPYNPDAETFLGSSGSTSPVAQAIGSTIPLTSQALVNPPGVNFNMKAAPFYRSANVWCGGIKFEWTPPGEIAETRVSDPANLSNGYPQRYSVTMSSYVSQNIPTGSFSNLTGVYGGSADIYNRANMVSGMVKNHNGPYIGSTRRGFYKNPSPVRSFNQVFPSPAQNATILGAGTQITNEVYGSGRSGGYLNFIFQVNGILDATLNAPVEQRTWSTLNLGSLQLKKYWYFDYNGSIYTGLSSGVVGQEIHKSIENEEEKKEKRKEEKMIIEKI